MKKIILGEQEEFLANLFMSSNRYDTGPNLGPAVCCPVCESINVHFLNCTVLDGEDNYKAWKGRGDAIIISMICESLHSWDLRFGFHKGSTYVAVENVEEDWSTGDNNAPASVREMRKREVAQVQTD